MYKCVQKIEITNKSENFERVFIFSALEYYEQTLMCMDHNEIIIIYSRIQYYNI